MSFLNLEGAYENELSTRGEFNPQAPKTAFMLPSGQRVVLPTEVLLAAMGGAGASAVQTAAVQTTAEGRNAPYETVNELGSAVTQATPPSATPGTPPSVKGSSAASQEVIPLVEEEMLVGKTLVETGRVRVRRETQEHVQTVNVPLSEVRWEVEHIPVEQIVDAQPAIRQVGETIIFPLVEERLVVTRELWLREEVHLRKVTSVVEKTADFPVRRDVLVEERTAVGDV